MTDIFAKLVLGHLVGDYLLQNRAMMMSKSGPGQKGRLICTLHCLLYTFSVCLFLWSANPLIVAMIFISHWPIDRWSLADKWMAAIHSRRPGITYYEEKIDAAFYAIVYAVTDNALHLIIMRMALEYIYR